MPTRNRHGTGRDGADRRGYAELYSQLPKRLESVIWLEQSGKPGYEQAQAIAQKKFDAVQKPFTYSFGVSSDAMDYQTLLSLLLTLLCAVIAAPVFASDAQTGAQDIQLCTKTAVCG